MAAILASERDRPESVAQLDARLTGDQEVAGSTAAGLATFFVEFDHEIFSTVIFSLPRIQEGQFSVSGERMYAIPVGRLEDKACPVNVW